MGTEKDSIDASNKLIAEFMKLTPKPETAVIYGGYYYDGEFFPSHKLQYHSSWDWLMPVVEKIETMEPIEDDFNNKSKIRVDIFKRCCDIEYDVALTPDIVQISGASTKIEAVWRAVIKFIQWYNQNNPQ